MAVSLVGTATGTSSCSVPTHAIGDLIVIFAYRYNNTGFAALPAGFRSILTKSGTTCSARVGYKIATATNDASGTWTNATNVTCHVYRSSTYSTGSSLYIGASASAAQTVNTVNYPAITLQHTDTTSWVIGFAGVNNLTETVVSAPSGMTNESTLVGTLASVAGHDTEGAVASWTSTNVVTTGTAGNSVSCTIELIENQPGTPASNFVQHFSYAYNNPVAVGETGNNWTYSIDPTLAGNGLVLAVSYPSGSTPAITDDQSNVWPTIGSGAVTADGGAGNQALSVFVLPSATTGTSKIIVGFGSTVQAVVKVWITQLYNVTATIHKSAHAANVNAAGIVSPGSITPTTNNCLILSYMASLGSVTTNPSLIVPETGYALNDADISWGNAGYPSASQFYLQGTAGVTTPRFYLNGTSTDTFNVVTVALTTGSQGTAKPSGGGVAPWIDRICYFGTNSTVASWLLQIPATGNCALITTHLSNTGTPHLTTVVDNDGSTWVNEQPGGSGNVLSPTRVNSPARLSRTATVGISGAGQNSQLIYYDVSNCATSPIAATAGMAGQSLNGLNTATGIPSITPTGANQLTIVYSQVGLGPSLDISVPSGAVYDLPHYTVWKGVAGISTTTMTVASTTWGGLQTTSAIISGTGVTVGTTIQSGTGPYTITPSQTVTAGTTMQQSETDSNNVSWGNFAGHYFNGANTGAQSWTWRLANDPTQTATPYAIVLAGPAGGGGTTYPGPVNFTTSSSLGFLRTTGKIPYWTTTGTWSSTKANSKAASLTTTSSLAPIKQALKAAPISTSSALTAIKKASKFASWSTASALTAAAVKAALYLQAVTLSTASSLGLTKQAAKNAPVATSSALTVGKASGKSASVSTTSTLKVAKATGRLLSWSTASALTLGAIQHRIVAIIIATGSALGMGRASAKSVGLSTTGVLSSTRKIAKGILWTTSGSAAVLLGRGFSQVVSVAALSSLHVVRQTRKIASISTSGALSEIRAIAKAFGWSTTSALTVLRGMARAVAIPTTSALSMSRAISKRASWLTSGVLNVAGILIHGGGTIYPQAVTLATASSLVLSRSITRAHALAISTLSSLSVRRSIGRIVSIPTVSVVNMSRAITHGLAVATGSSISFIRAISTAVSFSTTSLLSAVVGTVHSSIRYVTVAIASSSSVLVTKTISKGIAIAIQSLLSIINRLFGIYIPVLVITSDCPSVLSEAIDGPSVIVTTDNMP